MKMVAAAKLKRSQDRILAARPYAHKMRGVLSNLSQRVNRTAHPLLQKRDGKKVEVLVVTSDRGLCGGFNTNLDQIFGQFDPQQRRVLHPWASFNGLCTAHYLAYDKAEIAASTSGVNTTAPSSPALGRR